MVARKQSAFGLPAAAKQVGLRGGYPGRRLVCSRASSIDWCRFCGVQAAGKIDDAISKRKGKH